MNRLVEDGHTWSGDFFQLRQNVRNLLFDASGYWSYPAIIPGNRGGMHWLHLVCTTEPVPDKRRLQLYRPRAMAITPVGSTTLLEYLDFRNSRDPFHAMELSWTEPVDQYPWRGQRLRDVETLKQKEAGLLLVYPFAAEQLERTGELPDSFADIFLTLNHPMFMRFYREVAPGFAKAMTPHLRARKADRTPRQGHESRDA